MAMKRAVCVRQRPSVVISDEEWDHLQTVYRLSPQQLEIVQAFVDGYSRPADIAKAIDSNPSGIATQIERLYKKIDAHSRAEVMVIVFAEVLWLRSSEPRQDA